MAEERGSRPRARSPPPRLPLPTQRAESPTPSPPRCLPLSLCGLSNCFPWLAEQEEEEGGQAASAQGRGQAMAEGSASGSSTTTTTRPSSPSDSPSSLRWPQPPMLPLPPLQRNVSPVPPPPRCLPLMEWLRRHIPWLRKTPEEECSICHQVMTRRHKTTTRACCGNTFHQSCLDGRRNCPRCNDPIIPECLLVYNRGD